MSDQELAKEEQVTEAEETEVTETAAPEASAKVEETATETTEEAAVEEASPEPATDEAEDGSIFGLTPGQHRQGKVKNITQFGAFVDMGLPQDGLVHISELAKGKVEKVEDVVSVGQEVEVWVKKVDRKRGRISLTMVKPIQRKIRDISEDDEINGTVTRLESYGAFIDIESERDGLVHISQITHEFIKHPEETLTVGETIKVKVLKVNRKKRQVDLSIKALIEPPVVEAPAVETSVAQKESEEIAVDEPIPTAMAVAFASLQGESVSGGRAGSKRSYRREQRRRKRQQEEIISRTLASGE